MNAKKEIRDIIAEHSAELKKGTMGYELCRRNIYLTGYDYVRVFLWADEIEISLHLNDSESCMFFKDGSINDLDSVWRRFRYRFKRKIAEEYGKDKAFAARLKEVYSLL